MNETMHFEEQGDRNFLEQISQLPEGEKLRSCLQCGTCGGACPVSPLLPHTPRKLFAMLRAGLKKEVLTSLTPWVCSSCYECTVACPAQIKITEIMYALKRQAGREGLLPEDSDSIRFSRLFTELVTKYGRAQEMRLLLKYMGFHHPIQMLKQSGLGLQMMLKGRMPLGVHSLEDLSGFHAMCAKAQELEKGVAS